LEEYYWPGNVRELRNVLERIYVETHGTVIGRNAFKEWIRERDYLSAGEWNIERLEDQKVISKTIIPRKDVTISPPFRRIQIQEQTDTPRKPVDTYKKYMSDQMYIVPRPFEGDMDKSTSTLDAEYQISIPDSKKRVTLTPELMRRAFQDANGNITLASSLLGIHKATFYRHMKSFGLTRESLAETVRGENGKHEEL
jgi:sigma-54 specific flagellar transcriptional regulator A